MITLIEAKNYRCLRYIRQHLERFHVLVGPNASGKTIFLDVVAFLGDLVSNGPMAAINARAGNFQDLLWRRTGDRFELAIEAAIPQQLRPLLRDPKNTIVRYEIALQMNLEKEEIEIQTEKVRLKVPPPSPNMHQRTLFPASITAPSSIISPGRARGATVVVNKVPNGNDNFYSEVYPGKGKGWVPSIKFGPQRSALGNLPGDEADFPVTSWLKDLLTGNVTRLMLNSRLIRRASPPGQGRGSKADGSNLPWVVEHFKTADPARFQQWLSHLRTALPDLKDVRTIERPEDKHRYLTLEYAGGLEVPSWMVSDGTLRLLALTILSYLPGFSGIYLIEEPENGIHPRAVEAVFQSLSSGYEAQILMKTHSPVILGMIEVDQVLCFAKTDEGAVDIVRGDEHPVLKDWKGEGNPGVLNFHIPPDFL